MYCWLLLHISPSDLWLVMYSRVTHVIVFYALICIFLKLYIHVNDVWFDTCCMKTLVRISCAVLLFVWGNASGKRTASCVLGVLGFYWRVPWKHQESVTRLHLCPCCVWLLRETPSSLFTPSSSSPHFHPPASISWFYISLPHASILQYR